jgi:hypothetical protein
MQMVTAIDLLDVDSAILHEGAQSGPQFARCKKNRSIVKAAVPMSCAIHREDFSGGQPEYFA